MKTTILIVEAPYQGAKEYPWNKETQQLFNLSTDDVEYLEDDKVLWRIEDDDGNGPVGYSLEDEE